MTGRRRSAMTMIEVLCATALASLMMIAVLGVVGGLGRHEKTLLRHQPAPEWQSLLEQQLFEDFQQATELKFRPEAVVLSGPLARDPRTGAATWAELEVTYRVVESPVGSLLLRSARDPRSATPAGNAEVATVGVSKLLLNRSAARVAAPPGSENAVFSDLRDGPPPELLFVGLLDDASQTIWHTELILQ